VREPALIRRSWQRRQPPFRRVAGAVAVVVAMLALTSKADWASAQGGAPTIEVANTIPAEPATQIPFPIRVSPSRAIPRSSFVRVRGLPPMAALSEGYSIAPGSWAVPLQALADLKITLPISAAGHADVVVSLIAVDGSVLAEVRTTLIVSSPPRSSPRPPSEVPAAALGARVLQPPPAERPERGLQPVSPPTVALTPVDREQALHLLKMGEEQLAQGLVAPARLLFERAADLGLAQAAMALAATYDAVELDKPNLRHIRPDATLAKRWYERARQLGASEAELRLRRLGAM